MPNYFIVQTGNDGMDRDCHEHNHHDRDCHCRCKHESQEPTRNCECQSSGELLDNPGFESFTAAEVPTDWTVTGTTASQISQGRVHSGQSAVRLSGNTTLTQTVDVSDDSRCYYEFSFFANAQGTGGPLTATVTFLPSNVVGLTIPIRSGDLPTGESIFSYYRGITSQAPAGTEQIEVRFIYGNAGIEAVNIDDVSLSVD
ncbi:hypothetical protein GMB70_05555 [Turicibacter sanguinis]|uniref:hypothetical protein n=1 Tax=Turicibacter sanguinis TaxID=154288 RepID=UPI0012BC1532|nr:hypothetical protein [Turicibacter sanguinis]MDB8564224.1 hypothetical protein [Turicibacter sanguinis]MTP78127.1 hypothetical protein [Turicibacter sanguinis]